MVSYLPQGAQGEKFDVLILADLLFNHSEHAKLVASVQRTLKRSADARAYVFFTPYRPWLLQKDLAFFDLAREGGFVVDKIFEKVMDKVMFEEDPGVSVVCILQLLFFFANGLWIGRVAAANCLRVRATLGRAAIRGTRLRRTNRPHDDLRRSFRTNARGYDKPSYAR